MSCGKEKSFMGKEAFDHLERPHVVDFLTKFQNDINLFLSGRKFILLGLGKKT